MTFRFDDVSVNTDLKNLDRLIDLILRQSTSDDVNNIVLTISPIVFDPHEQLPSGQSQRVHPRILTAQSALTPYYRGTRCGVPALRERYAKYGRGVSYAAHGIVHVDHRLLDRQAQEISILTSCALAQANIFVPPYNKWNRDTEMICEDYGITLVRFETGWKHVTHNPFDRKQSLWYLHPYDMTVTQLEYWFDSEKFK